MIIAQQDRTSSTAHRTGCISEGGSQGGRRRGGKKKKENDWREEIGRSRRAVYVSKLINGTAKAGEADRTASYRSFLASKKRATAAAAELRGIFPSGLFISALIFSFSACSMALRSLSLSLSLSYSSASISSHVMRDPIRLSFLQFVQFTNCILIADLEVKCVIGRRA